jgi:hypothetical protein
MSKPVSLSFLKEVLADDSTSAVVLTQNQKLVEVLQKRRISPNLSPGETWLFHHHFFLGLLLSLPAQQL